MGFLVQHKTNMLPKQQADMQIFFFTDFSKRACCDSFLLF